jgi:hypothetical protein
VLQQSPPRGDRTERDAAPVPVPRGNQVPLNHMSAHARRVLILSGDAV